MHENTRDYTSLRILYTQILQREYFQSSESVFEKGTDLTIIDNQYLILSEIAK